MEYKEIENHYHDLGLLTEHGTDKPGTVYPPHIHEMTYLYTLTGSLSIRIRDGDWQTLQAGDEFIIQKDELHEAKVGEDGWEYVAAWSE